MTKQVLFVQGGGEGTHDEWDNKLVASLERELGSEYEIRYPLMPNEADPNYTLWKTALNKEFASLDDGAILVGHSIGATMLINLLAEQPYNSAPNDIFLIAAAFVGKDGWPSEDIKPTSDLGTRLHKQSRIYLYHGTADNTVPPEHVDLYQKAIPQAMVHRLAGRDHQLNDDLSEIAADIRRLE
jgi:predicted alpha/beta hydrolase family esterase